MKKYSIPLVLLGMILTVFLLLLIISSYSPKVLIGENILAKVTLDGKVISNFPTEGDYEVDVNCENAIGKWIPDKWILTVENITGNVTCIINFKTNPKKLLAIVEENGTTKADGIRYSGKTPKNYVLFNGDIYRIIGSIPTKLSDGTTKNLVKIMRDESLYGLAFDAVASTFTGVWANSTLYTHLNTHFYASTKENLNGQNSVGCKAHISPYDYATSRCNYTNTGILSTSYYGQMVEQVYWNTGVSSELVTVAEVYDNEVLSQTVLGYIGIMNISDYGYATSETYHNVTLNNYGTKEISSANWIYNGSYEWTITEASNVSQCTTSHNAKCTALRVGVMGDVNVGLTNNGVQVRPVLHLKDSVYVVSGEGTEENPYIIGM